MSTLASQFVYLFGDTPEKRFTWVISARDVGCATAHVPSRITRRVENLRRFSMPARQLPFALVNLANAFLAGPWTLRSMVERGKQACPDGRVRISSIARRAFEAFGAETAPSLETLLACMSNDRTLSRIAAHLGAGRLYLVPLSMAPRCEAARTWTIPQLVSEGQLAEWLSVSAGHLDWLADLRGWCVESRSFKLRHYVCRWQPRRRGRFRLIESPKPKLKKVQRRILHGLLDHIPAHPAAHGFLQGRSISSYAAPHVGQRIVLRFDLRDFFPAIAPSRVHALFRTAGYPHDVARLLTGLCTSRVPLEVWESRPEPRSGDAKLGDRLRGRHLPQGAPTSPALANLCARRLDARLHGLAQKVGAAYTRYADDLAFSGGKMLERCAHRFQVAVAVIVAEEGFELHFQKSRFMRQGICQQLAGIVVNERLNVRREVYDKLKAILTNCIRHGPSTQNRAAHADFRNHLLGRIAHVQTIHPQRGAKLRALFDQIAW